jgi:hypothetical protein
MVDMAAVTGADMAAVDMAAVVDMAVGIGATEAAATEVDTTAEVITAVHITMTDTMEAPITITAPHTESVLGLADTATVGTGTGIMDIDKRGLSPSINCYST